MNIALACCQRWGVEKAAQFGRRKRVTLCMLVGETFPWAEVIEGVRSSCAETIKGEEISVRRSGGERINLRVGVRGVVGSFVVGRQDSLRGCEGEE